MEGIKYNFRFKQDDMIKLICLDLEGVLVPEIWINVSKKTKIEELKLTTRDIPDYDVLMKKRIGILKEHGLKLKDIQNVIKTMSPLKGAKKFLDKLRSEYQVIILSDTFTQFAKPLMQKLGWPVIFCNSLEVSADNMITGYTLRQNDGKKHAAAALKNLNFHIVAAGDSYNDLAMLKQAHKGILFCPPKKIIDENHGLPITWNYDELFSEIKNSD